MSTPEAALIRLSEELFEAQHHALLRAILDNISEGISITDASGKLLYHSAFSRKVYNMEGLSDSAPHEWSHRHGLFRPDGRTPYPAEELPLYQALQGKEIRDVDLFVRNPSVPEGLYVRCTCIPLFDEQQRLLGVMSLTRNIDRQHRMEVAKERSEQNFQRLVETAQEGVWTIDAEWYTTYVNRFMASMLGYTVEEMLGKHIFNFMDEEGRKNARENLEQGARAPMGKVRDFPFQRKDGTRIWTSMSTTPLIEEVGRYSGSLAMVTDITPRRAAEEQIRQSNALLEQRIAARTEQLEFSNRELEAFAYTVAHDLRTPLRSISSFSEALVEDCAGQLDSLGLDYLRRITGGAKRMAELIDGILSLSRVNRTSLDSRPCDLTGMAHAIVEQLQTLHPERCVYTLIQEGMVEQGDPRLLRSALENLLSNAWKFTRERPDARIEFSATRDERGVRVYQVRDNGAGFNMAYQDKLFGVFQRLHTQEEFEGHGVGLAAVQRIVRRHGGRVWGEGEPGRGACFRFTLNEFPLPPGTAASIAASPGERNLNRE